MNRILAAFIFFTRLPFWRFGEVPAEAFKKVVVFWPLTGWLTSGITVLVFYLGSLILPVSVALILAWISRLLVTGCLREDGLADCLDGFGGGTSRERTLAIMKDSHTGSYAMIGLPAYGGLLYTSLSSLPVHIVIPLLLAADPFFKLIAAQLINILSYARKEADAKNKIVYERMNNVELFLCILYGVFPLVWINKPVYLLAILLPLLMGIVGIGFIKKKISGYTGDCCGALFLLCEVSFYLSAAIIYHLN
ncbi:MAG: adenosylcobinamide-GDP ribazoletransferase [Tannerellaceae bacterium]|nr:adenosylcobinamide-GDP ribazoletransferase [Tannerellaceae bacterium]